MSDTWTNIKRVFFSVAIGVVILYAFFAIIGLLRPWDVLWLTIPVVVLAAIFAWHSWQVSRIMDRGHPDPELLKQRQRTRERRGF